MAQKSADSGRRTCHGARSVGPRETVSRQAIQASSGLRASRRVILAMRTTVDSAASRTSGRSCQAAQPEGGHNVGPESPQPGRKDKRVWQKACVSGLVLACLCNSC